MNQGFGLLEIADDPSPSEVPAPRLLVELEPRHRVFFRNLGDLFWRKKLPPLHLVSWPAAPWPDVLVPRPLPWWGFAESSVLHLVAIALLLGAVRFWAHRAELVEPQPFHHDDVIYYDASEYLPPLDTGGRHVSLPQTGQPEYAPQPIISVPPEADNHTQTIVTPPTVKLNHDVPLPNMVTWSQHVQPSVPLAATARSASEMRVPEMTASVVAPPPEVQRNAGSAPVLQERVVAPPPDLNSASDLRDLQAPQAAVVAPPPQMENAASIRRLGDINIGHAQAVAPAPRLPVGEQRTGRRVGPLGGGAGVAAVPPPPSIQGGASGAGGGQIIALSIHPLAPNAPAQIPSGNRRGSFSATPQGKPSAPGTPDVTGEPGGANGSSAAAGKSVSAAGAGNPANGVPPGLYVGAAPKSSSGAISGGHGSGAGAGSGASSARADSGTLIANANPPRVAATPRVAEVSEAKDLERQVFGGRKYYSMMVSMPNFTSAGGSWIIRFAELKKEGDQSDADPKAADPASVLSAPIVVQQVDPKYPLELMHHNVQGTVTLYAIIRSDGSVADVKVLRGVDDRIDQYAREALEQWRFHPGTKNGTPVDVEAVVAVPFKPTRMKPLF
jgi:TonB family protein